MAMQFISSLIQLLFQYWIGLQRTGNGFAWVDDSAVDFEYWRDGEPNDEHEFCVEVKINNDKKMFIFCRIKYNITGKFMIFFKSEVIQ